MLILQSINELKKFRASLLQNESLGLVPTMGALHKGHLTLVEEAKKNTDTTMVSIFVNPLQFNDPVDFNKYPKQVDQDLLLLEKAGCDAVFIPKAEEIYHEKTLVSFDFGPLSNVMEGLHRPGHFNGVAIVVSKLLNLIKPHKAFFGEKDLQQVRIIQCLVRDLGMDVEIIPCTTIRESDGLALSSRNMRLSPEQRLRALCLSQLLHKAKKLLGTTPHSLIEKQIQEECLTQGFIRLDYFNIVEKETLQTCANPLQDKGVAICIAAFVDEVRLIDNIIVSS